MLKPGDIILTEIQFTDSFETKKRPALILFEELGNYVVAGITSNLNMKGIKLEKKEGLIKESVIKLNYLFTVSEPMIQKTLSKLNEKQKKEVYEQFNLKLNQLLN